MTLEQLETCIVHWAHIRGIAEPGNGRNQLLKTVEELGELSRATLKNDKAGIKDGIGDVLVTLIIFAHTQGLDINTCLDAAWKEIKDRQGTTVNGTFIKNVQYGITNVKPPGGIAAKVRQYFGGIGGGGNTLNVW